MSIISTLVNIDQTILFFIQGLHNQFLDKLMIAATILGDKGAIWICISFILIMNKKTRTIGIITLFSLVLSTILGEGIIKHLVQRTRPYINFPTIKLLIKETTYYSFPSGHATSSFAAAYVLGKYLKRYAIIFWLMAGLISVSRIYLFMHYPSDIIAGIALGLTVGIISVYIHNRMLELKNCIG